jgi:hypothetical protein
MTVARVQLRCKTLKRFKLVERFSDSHGIAVGNTYQLNELGERAREGEPTYEWAIWRIFKIIGEL